MYNTKIFLLIILSFFLSKLSGQEEVEKFKQLGQKLATPNVYRTATGSPGPAYYQARADYNIKVTLDESKDLLTGTEEITFYNNSPDPLSYIWLQLDQNIRAKNSDTYKIRTSTLNDKYSNAPNFNAPDFDGGFNINSVTKSNGASLKFTINRTMMRVDLSTTLLPKEKIVFNIKYNYKINDRVNLWGRSGYEEFKDNNKIYTIAQFFPRMCVYNDIEGWQHKQFLGRGEFTLLFGDYNVSITVPSDHILGATGINTNPDEVLTSKQKEKIEKAKKSFTNTVLIVSQKEAEKNEKTIAKDTKTWKFTAKNVRDFAFASSRKFIWDAMAVKQEDGTTVIAQSLYPKEANPLWGQYSTKAVAHTIKWYSHYTFPYPYPHAYSVHCKKRGGMEYPMMAFNGYRPEEDGTYDFKTKRGLISVIIHETGHNYFPMIVNSDERQWTWMDEGLNTFLQTLTEQHWEHGYASWYLKNEGLLDYMSSGAKEIVPIMTNSESVKKLGPNAYGKPTAGLIILRETILGRELFDFAFKTYCNKWKFKQPYPADFFRTMEDASGTDLDWFWRGWFYSTDWVDLSIKNVKWAKADDRTYLQKVKEDLDLKKKKRANDIMTIKNKETGMSTYIKEDSDLKDFYNTNDFYKGNKTDEESFSNNKRNLSPEQKEILKEGLNYYEVTIENIGGLIMPLIIQFKFKDGTDKIYRIPVEIWLKNAKEVSKVFQTEKEVEEIILDPFDELFDTDKINNSFPQRQALNRFELFKKKSIQNLNPMQK